MTLLLRNHLDKLLEKKDKIENPEAAENVDSGTAGRDFSELHLWIANRYGIDVRKAEVINAELRRTLRLAQDKKTRWQKATKEYLKHLKQRTDPGDSG